MADDPSVGFREQDERGSPPKLGTQRVTGRAVDFTAAFRSEGDGLFDEGPEVAGIIKVGSADDRARHGVGSFRKGAKDGKKSGGVGCEIDPSISAAFRTAFRIHGTAVVATLQTERNQSASTRGFDRHAKLATDPGHRPEMEKASEDEGGAEQGDDAGSAHQLLTEVVEMEEEKHHRREKDSATQIEGPEPDRAGSVGGVQQPRTLGRREGLEFRQACDRQWDAHV